MEESKLNGVIAKMGAIANNRYLNAIRNGMSVIIPIVILGSVFTIALNLPIDAWKEFIAPYTDMLKIPMTFATDFMSVYVVIGIASSLCEDYKMDKVSTSAIALLGFLIATITPATIDATAAEQAGADLVQEALAVGRAEQGGPEEGVPLDVRDPRPGPGPLQQHLPEVEHGIELLPAP